MYSEVGRQRHQHIANHVPDALQLTDASPNNEIGSFMMPTVRDGDYIPFDLGCGLEADFRNINALSPHRDLPGEYAAFKEKTLGQQSGNQTTRELLGGLAEREQNLVTASLFAVTVAAEFFGDIFSRDHSQDNRRKGWTQVDPEHNYSLFTKQLSETADSGVCMEYSIFTQEVLSRLGEDVALTAGFHQIWRDEDGFPHAFLSADEGRLVVDPFFMTMFNRDESATPRGIYKATTEQTFLSNPAEAAEYMDLAGNTALYSASPIAAVEVSAAPDAAPEAASAAPAST